MRSVLFARSAVLGLLLGLSMTPAALAQSLDIPLQYEQGASGLILTINVGINGATQRPYLFDTGSGIFNAYYSSPAVFGGIAGQVTSAIPAYPNGLPTGVVYKYGDGQATNEFDVNIVAVPSLTFYATPNSTSGVTLNAVTPNGTPSNFLVGAVYGHVSSQGKQESITEPLAATSSFSGYYGIFGADALAQLVSYKPIANPPTDLPPISNPNNPSVPIGGILGQAVLPGATAGYIVAANGQSLGSQLGAGAVPVPGSSVNGPQASGCAIASCGPGVMLGLTPALLAQFAPADTLAATPSGGVAFPNSGAPALIHYPIDLSVTLNIPGQAPVTITQQTLLDTGTVNNQIYAPGLSSGSVPQGATLTVSNGNPTGSTTTYTVSPAGAGPYGVTTSGPIQNANHTTTDLTYLGIGFFLQNSVLYDLAGEAIGYTPNYVTDQNIVTTLSSPLTIGSNSAPLGLAGVISGPGGISITQGGSATLSGTNIYMGATTVAGTGAVLAIVGPGSIASSSGVSVSGGGLFDISGAWSNVTIQSLAGDANGAVTLGANTLNISNANGSFAGSITGSGGLTLSGGVETLSGINAYTGPTTIDGGTLVVNGILAGTSNVTVNAGGALAGNGIIDPPLVTIGSGATLTPGTPGVPGSALTIIGNLAFQPGALYAVSVSPSAAITNVTGTAAPPERSPSRRRSELTAPPPNIRS